MITPNNKQQGIVLQFIDAYEKFDDKKMMACLDEYIITHITNANGAT
jgi:hypothetical protein